MVGQSLDIEKDEDEEDDVDDEDEADENEDDEVDEGVGRLRPLPSPEVNLEILCGAGLNAAAKRWLLFRKLAGGGGVKVGENTPL